MQILFSIAHKRFSQGIIIPLLLHLLSVLFNSLIDEHRKIIKTINFNIFDKVDILEADTFDQLVRGAIAQPIFPSQKIFPGVSLLYSKHLITSHYHNNV